VRKIFLICFILFASDAYALRPYITTECMVNSSAAIVTAEFIGSSKKSIYSDRMGDLYLAKFGNAVSLKGFGAELSNTKEFTILWRKGKHEYPNF
jgi:hypothetical protein